MLEFGPHLVSAHAVTAFPALPTILAILGAIVLLLLATWLGLAFAFHRRMADLERAERFGEAAREGERWFRVWPFGTGAVERVGRNYLASDRRDTEALSGIARAMATADDPLPFARALVDRSEGGETSGEPEALEAALEVLVEGEGARPKDRLRLAGIARRSGDSTRAKKILHPFVEGPTDREALVVLRDIVLEQKTADPEAERILRESLEIDPDHGSTIMALYRILESRWDTLESSESLYEKALELDPSLAWAHAALGEILKNQGRTGEAIVHFLAAKKDNEVEELLKKRVADNPKDPSALEDLKDFYLLRRRVDGEARSAYRRWRNYRPDDSVFQTVLLEVYEDRGFRGAEAVEMYEDAVAKESANERLRRLLADSLRDAGRIRDAVWVLEEARDDFPDDLDIHRALARLYTAEGVKTGRSIADILVYVEKEYDEAVAAYLKDHFMSNDEPIDMAVRALEIWSARHGKDLGAVARLARLHLARKDAAKGIPVLNVLLRAGQSGPWLVRGLAELHAMGGDGTPDAEEAYARAIASGVASDEVLLALAGIYASKDRKDPLAAEVCHRASGIEGCPPDVKVLLAEVYFDGNGFEDAASLCQEVLRVHPGHARAQMLEARALLKAGHVEGALDRLWEAHRASPGELRSAEDLAEALAAKGEVSEGAVSVYEKYLTLARKGADKVNLDAGWAVMRVLGLARFRAGKVEKGLSVIKALYSRENSRPMGERLVADVGVEIPDLVALEIGRTLLKLGDFSRARPLLVRGVKPDPSAVTVILEAVREARASFPQQLGQAIHLCEALREQVGDDAHLLWEVVEGYLAEGDVEEAATRTRKILGPGDGPDPSLPEALWDQIQERWLSVVAKGHRSASAFYIQGRARLAQGEPKDALRWFKQSRSLDAKDRNALAALKRTYQILAAEGKDDDNKEKLADLYMEEGEVDEAIPVLQSLPESYPRKREVVAKLARCFIEKGHPLIASKNLERALGEEELEESSAEMFYTLANAYEAAGDLRKAKITFEKIGFWNYTYRDVRERLSDLGKKVAPTPSTPVTPSPFSPVPERKTLAGLETAELPVGKMEGGRFEVLELRGRGGMAVVYKALDHEFDPPLIVALKVLPEEFAYREKAVRLLKREASAAIQLTHPGIVRIFSTGEEQGKRYISMEYIEGPDFATVLDRRGKLPHETVMNVFRQALEALGYAHETGVIHKDIKPSNLMLTQDTPSGRVKITDFGIARVVTDQIGVSRTLSVRGTLPYMSPQQIAGEPADGQSDIYSLGITVYEMLAGDPPFMRGDVAYQHTYKAPASVSELVEGIPPALDAIVMRCLEKKPAVRYKTMGEILADMNRAAE